LDIHAFGDWLVEEKIGVFFCFFVGIGSKEKDLN
jgi:hypothetical protein